MAQEAFTTLFNELLALDPEKKEQFAELVHKLKISSVLQAEKTALVVNKVIHYLQTDTGKLRYWDNATNTANEAWKTLHLRLIKDSRIVLSNNGNSDHNVMDKVLWELKGEGRTDDEMRILLTLAEAAFGRSNFKVFRRSALKSTVYTPTQIKRNDAIEGTDAIDGIAHLFDAYPEGVIFYNISLLLPPIKVDGVPLTIQLFATNEDIQSSSKINCDVTPQGDLNCNFLKDKIIKHERSGTDDDPITACIKLVPEHVEAPNTISVEIPRRRMEEGMDTNKCYRFQLTVHSKYGRDTQSSCPAQRLPIEIRIVEIY